MSLATQESSETIISNEKIKNKSFEFELFDNYSEKFLETHHYLLNFMEENAFKPIVDINGVLFFIYNKESDDKFMQFHYKSLSNLSKILPSLKGAPKKGP